jgi:NAD(P)-dependent dehydrogenase (short-subunit alcohol dehydrogenase family)
MDLAERHIVITGAAGGLGPAVVDAMLGAGAICHLPVRDDGDRLPRHARILAVEGVNLADEGAVTSFYARCPPLWASIHLAGGFKAALIADTSLADLRAQLDVNLATAFLCSREAVRNMRATCAARAWAGASSTSARGRRRSRPVSRWRTRRRRRRSARWCARSPTRSRTTVSW